MTALLARWLRELRWAVHWHRRLLAAGLAAGAVAAGLTALAPAPADTVAVVVAARDLPGGRSLLPADLTEARLPSQALPDGAVRHPAAAQGRLLAGPVRRGEPLTDVRLLGSPLLEGLGAGLVATPVRIADAGAVRLLRPGALVDVLAAETGDGVDGFGADARVVAPAVRVLTVPAEGDDTGASAGLGGGALVVLATRAEVATALAGSAVSARLSITLRPS